MEVSIKELANKYNTKTVYIKNALRSLDISCDNDTFTADEDVLELIKDAVEESKKNNVIHVTPNSTPREIAQVLDVSQSEIQKLLISKFKVMATLTTALKDDVVERIFEHYEFKVEWGAPAQPVAAKPKKHPTKASAKQIRPAIVTVMGHVDHGKTSLLDFIRKADIASGEHGGITQHIGAYQVHTPQGIITFLDTPGHEAFTAMRARGAKVTDIAILVVSADDGIMPQTIEAIHHAQNAEVPIIVAVNKIDKPGANPDKVLAQLTEHGLIPEVYGGQTITCNVSAKTGEGIPELLEMICLQAEVLQLEAEPKGEFEAAIIEAKLDKGRGPVATLIIENGTLKVGDSLAVNAAFGKVKAMLDYTGKPIKEAAPATPVAVLGFNTVPSAGSTALRYKNEKIAREFAEKFGIAAKAKEHNNKNKAIHLKDLRNKLATQGLKELKLIVKADVDGSLEAVNGLLEKLDNDEVVVKVIHSGVGSIMESDILLASAAEAICVGFNTRTEPNAKQEAEKLSIEIRHYKIIYELIEDIEAAVKGMLAPKFEEEAQGTLEVRVVFNLSRHGIVAGSYVQDGKITRDSSVRIKRNREIIFDGKVASLKHLRNDVKEVKVGMECGVQLEDFTDFKEGDIFEVYQMIQIN